MNGLAKLARHRGYMVSGSDRAIDQNAAEYFSKDQINVSDALSSSELDAADIVCYSTAIHHDHPSLVRARDLKIQTLHRSEFLNLLIEGKTSVAVSGSHGKSSTAAVLAHIASLAGISPNCVIGARMLPSNESYLAGNGPFIVEADDHDGTLTNIQPTNAIITNIDCEHLENYGSLAKLQQLYFDFLSSLPPSGYAVVCHDNQPIMDVARRLQNIEIVTYGYDIEADVKITYHGRRSECQIYELYSDRKDLFPKYTGRRTQTTMLGKHGVSNTSAAQVMAALMGLDSEIVLQAPRVYSGLDRRMFAVGQINGAHVFDDYAHHPTEIRAVLETLKEDCEGSIFVIFEPHRHTRVSLLFDDFAECFESASQVIVTPVYSPGDEHAEEISHVALATAIHKKSGCVALPVTQLSEALLLLKQKRPQRGDVVILLSAGNLSFYRACIVEAFSQD